MIENSITDCCGNECDYDEIISRILNKYEVFGKQWSKKEVCLVQILVIDAKIHENSEPIVDQILKARNYII